MDASMIDEHLENLDRRLSRIEQILPTLATKADLRSATESTTVPLATKAELRSAIESATAPLATKAELRSAIESATVPLATKAELRSATESATAPLATKAELKDLGTELRQEIREEGERSRLYMRMLIEGQDEKLQVLAEHVLSLIPKPREE